MVFNTWRQCAPPPNTCFLGSIRVPIPNSISIGSAVYAQLMAERPNTLQWAALSPLKIAPSHGGSRPPYNAWFLGFTQVLNPNGISLGSAVVAGLTTVTDRQTEHATLSVTIGHI